MIIPAMVAVVLPIVFLYLVRRLRLQLNAHAGQ